MVTGKIWHVEQSKEPAGMWLTVQHLGYSKHASEQVGMFLWTVELANLLMNALLGYRTWYGATAPEYQHVPLATPPPDIPPAAVPAYQAGRNINIDHNNVVENGRAEMANVIGQMVAQLMNEWKPDKVPCWESGCAGIRSK
jgi:hypothetical protein